MGSGSSLAFMNRSLCFFNSVSMSASTPLSVLFRFCNVFSVLMRFCSTRCFSALYDSRLFMFVSYNLLLFLSTVLLFHVLFCLSI